jgi:hypothetical protein
MISIRLKRWLKGMSKSLTVHAGTLVLVVGYLQGQDAWITRHFGESATGDVMMGLGVLMILLRAKTSESLESKGSK